MSHREEVLDFLNKIAPSEATNAEIVSHTHIKPHQQVFQITRKLANERRIKRWRAGRDWLFSVIEVRTERPKDAGVLPEARKSKSADLIGPLAFERLCRKVMSQRYGTELRSARPHGVPKQFDLVSEDGNIIGDAKYYTAVNGTCRPSAKFATIAEYIWLLEKTKAKQKFLVFGNDRRVPKWWLDRYGDLLSKLEIYFLSDDGELESLISVST